MDTSIGEQLVQQVADALNVPSDKPCTFWRTRVDAFQSAELPACVVYAVDDQVERIAGDAVRHTLTVRLEFMVSGEPPVDRAADPLYVFSVRALFADAALRGMVRGLFEGRMQWETEASYEDACCATKDFQLVFTTKATDPSVRV